VHKEHNELAARVAHAYPCICLVLVAAAAVVVYLRPRVACACGATAQPAEGLRTDDSGAKYVNTKGTLHCCQITLDRL
jgi:hypothetical protein